MHSLDPLQFYAHEYRQRLLDEAAHDALLATLPRYRPARSPLDLMVTRRYLADALRALARRLDTRFLADIDQRIGVARPR